MRGKNNRMTVQPKPNPGPDVFHKERSKCLDAFVLAEEALITLLERSRTPFNGECVGQKIEKLRKAKPGPQYSKTSKGSADALLLDFASLQDIRNDLVHSRLQVARLGDRDMACFINARQCASGSQVARLMTLESLRDLARKATAIADALRKV